MIATPAKHPLYIRAIWLYIAVSLLVFCAPVKRLVEYRLDGIPPATTVPVVDKKLHTGYRQKHDKPSLIQKVTHHLPVVDNMLPGSCALSGISFLAAHAFFPGLSTGKEAGNSSLPLYLRHRRLLL
jgi:hypothetical protein